MIFSLGCRMNSIKQSNSAPYTDNNLLSEIRQLIDASKAQVAVAVNSAMTLLYWHIGERINREILGGERAAYGKQVVATLSRQLTEIYGKGVFSEKHLRQMTRFAEVFSDEKIVYTVCRQLTWSHLRYLTILPDKHLLESKLKQAISRAKSKLEDGNKIDKTK